jgi:predicted NBD/HSP70 family sugar kinase
MDQLFSLSQIGPRQREQLRTVLNAGRCSRSQLHADLGIRKNTVTQDVAKLLQARLLRACASVAQSVGRPRLPLEIDPQSRWVIGLAIEPRVIHCGRVNLLGEPMEADAVHKVRAAAQLVDEAARMVKERVGTGLLAVGLSLPGFIDRENQRVLFSSVWPRAGAISLAAIAAAANGASDPTLAGTGAVAGAVPLIVDNDLHAVAARWLLRHGGAGQGDRLIVFLGDGQVGSTLLIEGKPNRGCVAGANELGHLRLGVETDRCYCGHTGCLERICSTGFLRRLGHEGATLPQLAAAGADGAKAPAMKRLLDLTASALGSAINFCRCGQVTLLTDMPAAEPFLDAVADRTRDFLLRELRDRVSFELRAKIEPRSAATAASLALAQLYLPQW